MSELLLAKNLFKMIHNTLITIHVAIKDVSSITRDTLNLIRIICENQVPFKWRQIWSGPRSIVDYIKAVVSRGIEAEKRFQGSSHIDFCDDIDFTKVFNVQSFLAALKLKNARYAHSVLSQNSENTYFLSFSGSLKCQHANSNSYQLCHIH